MDHTQNVIKEFSSFAAYQKKCCSQRLPGPVPGKVIRGFSQKIGDGVQSSTSPGVIPSLGFFDRQVFMCVWYHGL